ncbi:MAG: sigma 54-interacting transcriptional regulator [Pyrinomonadaceae bacterium]|nr:sigma 54-interacting transcriptional regulator [Pyrinomonadaceae bacterium]
MNLASSLLQQLANPDLTHDERVQIRCHLAKEMEEAGNYEAARSVLESLWQRVGERPEIEGLNKLTAAELLLRAGSLSGWIGSSRQIEGSQEIAKDLISQSIGLYQELQDVEKECEAQITLAICYWREGAFDEARIVLNNVITRLDDACGLQKGRALINLAMVERGANRHIDALRILVDSSPLIESVDKHSFRGSFHTQLASVLNELGTTQGRSDYIDRSLVEYAAASFHYGEAGNVRYKARVENNLGFLFLTNGRLSEAHEHLDRARRLFASLKDKGSVAQVDETRARAFLEEGKNAEAEKVVRVTVRVLEEGGEQAHLAEALTTWGVALARLGKPDEARRMLERAGEVAYQAGDIAGAGVAALTLLEELSEQLEREEKLGIYERADQLLSQSQHPGILSRLRLAARKALQASKPASTPQADKRRWPNFVYASDEMAELLKRAHRIATTLHPLLISGEPGTGKELLARLVHEWSGRAGEFVAVNCGALTDSACETELFGNRWEGFSERASDNPGLVRQAAGGTLLLDEIAELSPSAQAKLLRVIEHGEIHTLGEPVPEYVDVRIIASTNHDLKKRVEKGSFREDLFYRLQAFHVEIPPLRERPEDIEALAKHFITEALKQDSKRIVFTPEAIQAMRRLPMEGNARELQMLIERTLLAASDGAVITPEAVETAGLRRSKRASFANPWEGFSLKEEVRQLESRFIELALKEAKGHVSKAARLLGFKHHESLSSLIETKHRNLLEARVPATPRRRSIIRRNKIEGAERAKRP